MRKRECIILVFRNIRYYIKSAASSFVRNGIMTFASFITVMCCLFLIGVCFLFTLNMNYISKQIESQCEIQAYLNTYASDETQQEAYKEILALDNVANAELETKDQAFANYRDMLGDRADVLDGLQGKDFLRSSIKVALKDIRNSDKTVKELSKINGVEEVKNRQDIVKKVIRFTSIVKNGSAVAMLILLIVAIFIIQNTIKLSVYAREEEIHIMKFVGATDHFIRMPFVIEGIMIGALGFAVSIVIITLGYNTVISSVQGIINLFEFIPIEKCFAPLAVSMAVFGILMGACGSAISLKRHLKV